MEAGPKERKEKKLKIDSKRSKDAASNSKRELKEVCANRDEVLKCVSHMDMDVALQTEQLEAALANLSDPYFCLGIRRVCVDSRQTFVCFILYSRHYVSLYYFTFQVWSLNIVQLIFELLVAGTHPSSITAAIVAFVQTFQQIF